MQTLLVYLPPSHGRNLFISCFKTLIKLRRGNKQKKAIGKVDKKKKKNDREINGIVLNVPSEELLKSPISSQ